MRVLGASGGQAPPNPHRLQPWARWARRAGCQIPEQTVVSVRAAGAMHDDERPEAMAEEDGADVTVRIQGLIGWWFGCDAQALIRRLDYLAPLSRVRVLIESPGGFIDDALALWADLHGRARDGVEIVTEGRGLVASAAVLPFLAGEERCMIAGSLMFLHEPWIVHGFYSGTRADVAETLSAADKVLEADAKAIGEVYALRTTADDETRSMWLTEDCWLTGDESCEAGLCHQVLAGVDDDEGGEEPPADPDPEPPDPEPRSSNVIRGRSLLRLRT